MATAKEKGKSGPTRMSTEDEPLKVNKWDSSAIKNALDDTAKKIMREEYGYVENHSIVDQRLLICSSACAFSIFALIYDYLYPFPASRTVLMLCAISYFILMSVVTVFSMYKEGNIFMVAVEKAEAGVGADSEWHLASTLPRFGDKYSLTLKFIDGGSKTPREATLEKSVAEWFDVEGTLLLEKYFTDVRDLHTGLSKAKKDK